MKKVNFWETNLINKYTVLNSIEEVKQLINNRKLKSFLIKDTFIPGEKIESMIEENASKNDLIINYTDNLHNVLISNSSFYPTIISTAFFEKYKDELKQIFKEQIINSHDSAITINDFVFDEELFNILLTKNKSSLYFENVHLTDEQIEKLQANFLNAYLENKQISTKYAISYYTKEDLETKTELSIDVEVLEQSKANNFQFLPNNAIIDIYQSVTDLRSEEEVLSIIKEKLNDLDKTNKPLIIKIDVEKRSIFSKIFKDSNFQNLSLVIKNDNFEYPINQYLEEEKKLETLITPIKNANLSPLERYLAVYNIVKNYKPYKENNDDKNKARYLRYILDNEYMVCVGYSKLLIELLDKVGIDANAISIDVDTSYDDGFTREEKEVELAGHQRSIISIDDDKYNIHGLYMADPTWDNSLPNNYLNHALMPFDKMQISKRMFAYNNYDVILDIHNFQEFNQQVNFLLKRQFKDTKNFFNNKTYNEILLKSYEMVCGKIIKAIQCDPKYQEFKIILSNCKSEEDYTNFLSQIGNYLLTRINKNISSEVILEAATASFQKLNNPSDSKKYYDETKNEYLERDLKTFPYEIPENEDFKLTSKKH